MATAGLCSSSGLESSWITLAAAALAWQTVSGMSFGDCAAPARKMPPVTAFHRPQLGMSLGEEAIFVAADLQRLGDFGGAAGWRHGLGQHHHVGVDLDVLARIACRRP